MSDLYASMQRGYGVDYTILQYTEDSQFGLAMIWEAVPIKRDTTTITVHEVRTDFEWRGSSIRLFVDSRSLKHYFCL